MANSKWQTCAPAVIGYRWVFRFERRIIPENRPQTTKQIENAELKTPPGHLHLAAIVPDYLSRLDRHVRFTIRRLPFTIHHSIFTNQEERA
jgi:hypothetical protein